jgi:hypothetical protein
VQAELANRRRPLSNFSEPAGPTFGAITLATTFGRFGHSGTRLNTEDSFKSKTDADNKRHTNAHQPLTCHSPIGVTIPPPPPQHKSSVKMRLFVPCYYFFNYYYN